MPVADGLIEGALREGNPALLDGTCVGEVNVRANLVFVSVLGYNGSLTAFKC